MTARPANARRLWPALALTLVGVFTALPAYALSLGSSSPFGGAGDFLPVDEALAFSDASDGNRLTLTWTVADGYYLYRDRIRVTPATDGVTLGTPSFSAPGEVTEDDYFGTVTVFRQPVTASVPVTLPEGASEATVRVTYQGCAEAGLCYPPQTREVLFYPGDGAATAAAETASGSGSGSALPENTESATGLAGLLSRQSLWVVAGLFFLLGLGLTFTPCVLPMVPIIASLVSGHNTRSTAHALALALAYVFGMSLTYAAAGVITGLLGASFNLQAQLQSPWVLITFAVAFVAFALAMFDVYELQLPRWLQDPLNAASHRLSASRLAGLFGIGALSALVVSPCVSAPLAGALLYISTSQDALGGGLALLALGLGMGVPLILVAVGGRRFLPSTGHWMAAVKRFYGVLLMAVAIWLLERLIPAWATLALWALLATVTGVQLGAFEAAHPGWPRTRKALGLVLFAYGLALLAGAVTGARDPLRPLAPFTSAAAVALPAGSTKAAGRSESGFERFQSVASLDQRLAQAREEGQPVMLDFYADWCISCKVMERTVFQTPEVRQALAPFATLQIDITDNTPEQQALLNRFSLFGPPAILFYNGDGDELPAQRVLGEMDQPAFLAHLRQVSAAL